MTEPYIGLMSGTSMDALDAVLVDLSVAPVELIAHLSRPLPVELRGQLLSLATEGENELERMASADVQLGRFSAQTVIDLLANAGIDPAQVRAIGSHGQTIRHDPNASPPYTVQIGDGNTIAQTTGITTITDFRRRDLTVGGQGAPLVPAFHAALFRRSEIERVVLNVGGMANISILPTDETLPVRGFDTGPGNVLLDAWINHTRGDLFDTDGEWARHGTVNAKLLDTLLSDPYFSLPPPKSTGRERFKLDWLQQHDMGTIAAQDVQATLVELTCLSIAGAIRQYAQETRELLVCGGGAYNRFLLERIAIHLQQCRVTTTGEYGLDPRWVEATAFAWLARQTMQNLPGNLPSVTGATEAVVLGAIYPGK